MCLREKEGFKKKKAQSNLSVVVKWGRGEGRGQLSGVAQAVTLRHKGLYPPNHLAGPGIGSFRTPSSPYPIVAVSPGGSETSQLFWGTS